MTSATQETPVEPAATDDLLTPRGQAKIKTRGRLLEAASVLFSEKGYAKTHAADITDRAGVAVGTLYFHFGDKEGLLREILFQFVNEINDRIVRVHQTPDLTGERLARAHVDTLIALAEEKINIQHLSFFMSAEVLNTAAGDEAFELVASQIESDLRNGIAQGVYRSDIDPRLAARAEMHMNRGLLAWWFEDPSRATREEVVDTLTKMRFSGLHTDR